MIEYDNIKRNGSVVYLHTTPRSFLPMASHKEIELISNVGVRGDRYATKDGFYSDRLEDGRQLTLFEIETIDALKRDHDIILAPGDHRRNITTRNVPLNHLVGRRFRIGDTLLEGTRLATPCRHLEQITGRDFISVLLNRSGLHARILEGGMVTVDCPILILPE